MSRQEKYKTGGKKHVAAGLSEIAGHFTERCMVHLVTRHSKLAHQLTQDTPYHRPKCELSSIGGRGRNLVVEDADIAWR